MTTTEYVSIGKCHIETVKLLCTSNPKDDLYLTFVVAFDSEHTLVNHEFSKGIDKARSTHNRNEKYYF
jgi:hypothetical protein